MPSLVASAKGGITAVATEIAVANLRATGCVSAMRSIFRLVALTLFVGLGLHAEGQTRPQFRPAVLGSGPDSLINQIDTEALLKKGQKDGAIMFCAQLDKTGAVTAAWTYRGTAGTEELSDELLARLEHAKFPPAIYEHQPVGVLLFASVMFSAENRPHIKMFLNQDGRELKQESDFVGPQPVIGTDSKFTGLHVPPQENPVLVNGIVDLGLKIDAKGNLKEMLLLSEDPPLLGFAQAAQSDLEGAKFIPAFRSGEPEDSDTALPLCYKLRP